MKDIVYAGKYTRPLRLTLVREDFSIEEIFLEKECYQEHVLGENSCHKCVGGWIPTFMGESLLKFVTLHMLR